ncbi:50s ribosomal protein l7/l12, partial [Quercus suber]
MSFILRFRHHLPNGLSRNPVVALNAINFSGFTRSFGQPARVEEEEEEEIDQRRLPTDYDPATFDPTEHRSPPTERVFRLVDEVSGLTLAEAAELGAIMMRKMGMKEPPTVGEEKKPEKTVFEIKLESYEASAKIKIIKEVRGFTDLGLKEAKDLVEKTPSVLKRGLSKEEGEQIIEKLKALGAKQLSIFSQLADHLEAFGMTTTVMAELP